MKKYLFCGIAAFCGIFSVASATLAQQTRELRPIQGNYYDTATIKPSVERIKSLKVPAGFSVAKFAEITNPRILAVNTDGTIYVSQRIPGTLTMLKDTNGDGVADVQKVVAEKKQLHGVAIDGGKLFFVTVKEIYVTDIKPDGTLSEPRMLIDDLPDAGQHPNRTIAVQNGKLWITVGSTCNACDESTPEAATILTTDLEGKNRKIYASGLRNTIGFGWHPVSKKLYGMDHGIDMLGDNDQEEELNEIKEGAKYGWAYVYANGKLNPHNFVPKDLGLTNEDWAKQSVNPVLLYTPHAAPMQMAFYSGNQFPGEYKNDGFVAMRGSWNRNPPSGYEIVRIRFDKSGNPTKIEPFLTGFLVKGGAPDGKDAHFARPVGLAQMKDGSMLLTDDTNNIIYRIAYNQKSQPAIMSREDISLNLPETAKAQNTIQVKSSAFAANGMIPDKYSAYFQDVSPEISWSNVPQNAKSLVLMVEDPDASLKPVTHWLVANIAPTVTGFSENMMKTEMVNGAMQGGNHNGNPGYYGPMPPPADKPHGYHFQVFALDTMLKLPSGYNRQALLDAMKGHVIAKGEIVGMYQRRPDIREKQ
jgi:Raf kinase inhibitor-like YbhB/YbcL family protein